MGAQGEHAPLPVPSLYVPGRHGAHSRPANPGAHADAVTVPAAPRVGDASDAASAGAAPSFARVSAPPPPPAAVTVPSGAVRFAAGARGGVRAARTVSRPLQVHAAPAPAPAPAPGGGPSGSAPAPPSRGDAPAGVHREGPGKHEHRPAGAAAAVPEAGEGVRAVGAPLRGAGGARR